MSSSGMFWSATSARPDTHLPQIRLDRLGHPQRVEHPRAAPGDQQVDVHPVAVPCLPYQGPSPLGVMGIAGQIRVVGPGKSGGHGSAGHYRRILQDVSDQTLLVHR